MSENEGAGATAPAPDLRNDMNVAHAMIMNRVEKLEADVQRRPEDLPSVEVLAELATEKLSERMGDLEEALTRLAEMSVAWPDENVDAAMATVQAEIGGLEVGKTAQIVSTKGSYSYDYITEGQITAEVRRRLATRGVAIWVSEEESKKDGSLTTVTVKITFVHARSGTSRSIRASAQGTDPGDKGHTKAMTTAIRVGLCKQFLQSGDLDPEDSNYDHERTSTAPAAAQPAARSGKQNVYETFARWAGGDVQTIKDLAAAMAITSLKDASDTQVQTAEDFIVWVRSQEHEVMQGRINDEGWPAIAKRWYETEGSITL